eukprot:CAMPEP_0204902642 /NCGR_PEP_ID=MMETSP1397-20131031/3792_1 /ASSEMBLY_ACC=CAM_ASM_000891 /TAXON_ID=49980 /ORGANISM="Climacostomum Climacostomum virens, Strain Stock W-24" /LENGTH=240 /DNA_ID=CAMNT_0052071177 /DNA_START=750 /DNA_END=1472 /DNA_ORIENTATION=+
MHGKTGKREGCSDDCWEYSLALKLFSMSQASEGLLLVGLSGIPGIGKSASSKLIEKYANQMAGSEDFCKSLGMDGFHLYRWQLDQAEDPVFMHRRRGAHFTFAPQLLLNKLERLKSGEPTLFPTFSHAEKDPREDAIRLDPSLCKLVVLEGNYLFCELPIWSDIRSLFDYKVFIVGDINTSMTRVVRRNSQALGLTVEETEEIVANNDYLNSLEILKSKDFADKVMEFYEKSSELLEEIS